MMEFIEPSDAMVDAKMKHHKMLIFHYVIIRKVLIHKKATGKQKLV